eukprot:TRINITY_DN7356_c0_g1_i1.p1 TRINITY_DN7356_c0_g1~~TRINITY_DN7356_c0_g1_i1.p1  ORF type:complete len:411 (-),score=88.29 TRINITY_DN7356_c0_g1_i1:526-1758(-)
MDVIGMNYTMNNQGEDDNMRLDTIDIRFLEVTPDKLTATYIGRGTHHHDVGSIRTNKPFSRDATIGYYEVKVLNAGAKGSICVGLAEKTFSLERQPGWEEGSYGYLAEDGKKFGGNQRGEGYSEGFTTGDVIGCGIIHVKQEIFFTKNGKYLGTAFRKVRGTLYPTIGMHSAKESITVNFGQKPFKFDLDGMLMESREKLRSEVKSIALKTDEVPNLIRQYLLHFGYSDTLQSFEEISGTNSTKDPLLTSLPHRTKIRRLIMEGEIEEAIQSIEESFPKLLASFPKALFALRCQQLIELIRARKLNEAVVFAQSTSSEFTMLESSEEEILQEVLGLLAYEDPSAFPIGRLLKIQQRESVADAVNSAVLVHQGCSSQSKLEVLLRQLLAVRSTMREENDNRGEELLPENVL